MSLGQRTGEQGRGSTCPESLATWVGPARPCRWEAGPPVGEGGSAPGELVGRVGLLQLEA